MADSGQRSPSTGIGLQSAAGGASNFSSTAVPTLSYYRSIKISHIKLIFLISISINLIYVE